VIQIANEQEQEEIGRHPKVREGLIQLMRNESDEGKFWACYAVHNIGCSSAGNKVHSKLHAECCVSWANTHCFVVYKPIVASSFAL
jgi:hypothetical protein